MNTKPVVKKNLNNLICHFCGRANPIYLTITEGLFRLCRECFKKSHPVYTLK
ncbi:MAG TPA: hypothetical protein VLH15_09130 [Dehalococcoidales bacterium]|nr:hypothetical protein [Dehalococcoidales bacterium]